MFGASLRKQYDNIIVNSTCFNQRLIMFLITNLTSKDLTII
jgi:hypothetical protein